MTELIKDAEKNVEYVLEKVESVVEKVVEKVEGNLEKPLTSPLGTLPSPKTASALYAKVSEALTEFQKVAVEEGVSIENMKMVVLHMFFTYPHSWLVADHKVETFHDAMVAELNRFEGFFKNKV